MTLEPWCTQGPIRHLGIPSGQEIRVATSHSCSSNTGGAAPVQIWPFRVQVVRDSTFVRTAHSDSTIYTEQVRNNLGTGIYLLATAPKHGPSSIANVENLRDQPQSCCRAQSQNCVTAQECLCTARSPAVQLPQHRSATARQIMQSWHFKCTVHCVCHLTFLANRSRRDSRPVHLFDLAATHHCINM